MRRCWQCVRLSECLVHYVNPTGQTVLVWETGLSPQERWMCWEISAMGGKGRWEGKEGEEGGVCLNMQPLWVHSNNIQSTSSLVLPPTEQVVKVETDWESQTIITKERYISGPEENMSAWLLFIRPHLLGQWVVDASFYNTFQLYRQCQWGHFL